MVTEIWTPHPAQPHGGLWYRRNDAGAWQYWSALNARWVTRSQAGYYHHGQADPRAVYRLTWCEPEDGA